MLSLTDSQDLHDFFMQKATKQILQHTLCRECLFFLNFYVSILLELELSLAQLLSPTYFKSILDLGIKLPGFFFPGNQIARLFFPSYTGN